MSPTNQGFMYGQPTMKYPMQSYNIPPMNSMPPHVMGPIANQEQQPTDPVQGHEAMGRVSVSGPGMVSTIPKCIYTYIPCFFPVLLLYFVNNLSHFELHILFNYFLHFF